MENLIEKIEQVKGSDVAININSRLNEFQKVRGFSDSVFSELCFCLMTANFQAQKSWDIQREIENLFFESELDVLRNELKAMGHRFWPQRAERIVLARKFREEIFNLVNEKDELFLRDWLVENIKGLGMKEASHFLRNIGFENIAIIDFHIVDLMVAEGLIDRPKSLSRKKYLEVEEILGKLAKDLEMSLAELDLYLWYIETGKILK
jgi:N-glycosylase/DNA lyase